MTWSDVGKIIVTIVASAGGIGGVVVFLVKVIIEKIAERMSKKYEIKLNKDLEKHKSNLINMNYISKTQFDVEFEIYRSLTKRYFTMMVSINNIFSPNYRQDISNGVDLERIKKDAINLVEKTADAQDCLFENAAFIPKNLYEKYDTILEKSLDLFWEYNDALCKEQLESTVLNNEWCDERHQRAKTIDETYRELNNELRDYLRSLTIVT